jgi:hypothetical protein
VNAVVFEKTDAETGMTTAARVRLSLSPSQMVHIDSSENQTIIFSVGTTLRRSQSLITTWRLSLSSKLYPKRKKAPSEG